MFPRLCIAWLAGTMDRKTLLLVLTGLMAISGAAVGLAPNYLTYMAGRALLGVVIGGFWSMSAATAMRLVPSSQVPRALAMGMAGCGAFFMGQFALFTYLRPFL